jgi:4-methyl-5(b-hydroxyethyl)-thiazole monophosphate biosynthesis
MVAVFLAAGFEEAEALVPADVLRRAGVPAVLAGIGGREIAGSHGIRVACDMAGEELDFGELEMMVLPGGIPGADNLEASPLVQGCLDFCLEKGRWIGAICAAPRLLGNKGILKGRRFTCFPGYEAGFDSRGYTGAPVERDGKIITARGAGVALSFGLELAAALRSREEADAIARAMQACI